MAFSVLVLHGPNLSLLAREQIDPPLTARAAELGVELLLVQANGEQGLLDALHQESQNVDAVLVNPGLLAPSAFSLAEGLELVGLPVVEVLLNALPEGRGLSALAGLAKKQVHGLGADGYLRALEHLAPPRERIPGLSREKEDRERTPPVPIRVGKSIGRKSTSPTAPARPENSGKSIGRNKVAQKAADPRLKVPKTMLTRIQVRDRIKRRLKGQETAEALAQWARETWSALQRGAACEAGAKDGIENALLTLMAGPKVTEAILVAQMAKLDP